MSEAEIEVDGLGEAIRALGEAEAALAEMAQGNQRAAGVILDAARPLVPRRTGALAASGRVERGRVVFGSPSVAYAAPVHWGVPSRGIPARPFLDMATRRTEPQVVDTYEAELQRIADRI